MNFDLFYFADNVELSRKTMKKNNELLLENDDLFEIIEK